MKITYDKSVDAVYISLVDNVTFGCVDFTYGCDPQEINGQIQLDFDKDGCLVGIEVLQASKKLPQVFFKNELEGPPNNWYNALQSKLVERRDK